jgi:hypothetical protein
MKYLLSFFIAIGISGIIAQSSATQNIAYTVAIDPLTFMNSCGNVGVSIYTLEEYPPNSLKDREPYYIPDSSRLKMCQIIMDKVKSGEITAYYDDMKITKKKKLLRDVDTSFITMEEYFQEAIPLSEVNNILSDSLYFPLIDKETGEYVTDGYNHEYYDTLVTYGAEHILSLSFFEEWTIDNKTNKISKEVKGYVVNVTTWDYYSGKPNGVKGLFYVPCTNKFKSEGNKVVNSFFNTARINQLGVCHNYGGCDIQYQEWWENNLLPHIKNPFVGNNTYAPFMSPNSEHTLYDCGVWSKIDLSAPFPYSEVVSKATAMEMAREESVEPMIDMNTGTEMYDENGNPKYETLYFPYTIRDISRIEFIEDWYFDEKTLSIQKSIKGVSPVIDVIINSEIEGMKSLFCIEY